VLQDERLNGEEEENKCKHTDELRPCVWVWVVSSALCCYFFCCCCCCFNFCYCYCMLPQPADAAAAIDDFHITCMHTACTHTCIYLNSHTHIHTHTHSCHWTVGLQRWRQLGGGGDKRTCISQPRSQVFSPWCVCLCVCVCVSFCWLSVYWTAKIRESCTYRCV